MTRQYDAVAERRAVSRALLLAKVCDRGLSDAVGRAGGGLVGFSAKIGPGDCLITLRATFPAGAMIAFVGGSDLGYCLLKAAREAAQDGLKWKADRYAKE